MNRNFKLVIVPVAAIMIASVLWLGCEKKEAPQPSQNVVNVPETSAKPTGPAETRVSTAEIKPAQPASAAASTVSAANLEALKNVVIRVYENETQPNNYIDISEFKTVCPEAMGDLFGTGVLTLNPTLPDEKKVPVDRVTSIEMVNMGLINPVIKGVGKITQPIGYRDCKITLKDPDETLTGIVVLCRNLEGKKTDGSPWALLLKQESAKKFYKVELIRK